MAQAGSAAGELMRRIGGTMLKAEKIERVLSTARSTIGHPQTEGERKLVQRSRRKRAGTRRRPARRFG